jgi:hypothetical protein
MVTVAIRALELEYLLRFYIEVGVGVGTFLPTPTQPKIPSDSESVHFYGLRLHLKFLPTPSRYIFTDST